MEPRQNYLAVGIFVLASMLGIVAFLIWMSDLGRNNNFTSYQTFVTESVNGLGVGSAVKYRGVDVGKVSTITIPRRDPTKVRIVMDIDDETPITEGTVAILQMQGITGLVYIELKGSVADGKKIEVVKGNKIPIIPSAPSQFKQIVDTVPDMIQKFTELANRLGNFASVENQKRFDQILVNMDSFSGEMGGRNENGQSLGDDLHKTVIEMRLAAASIKKLSDSSNGDMKHVLKNLNKLTGTANDLSKQSYQNLHELLLELQKTARDLQALSRDIKENPSKIIIPAEPGGVSIPRG